MEMSRPKEHNENHNQNQFAYDYDGNLPNGGHRQMIISSSASSSSSSPTLAYIQHPISKWDTLAGIAIKYGVEVAEIRKMNSLVTDSQMFALETLHIPLHGRHRPSPFLPNGSIAAGLDNPDHSPTDNACRELFESFQSLRRKSSEQKLSPAMSSLQRDYYGTKPTIKKSMSEIFNMVEYSKRDSKSSENGSFYSHSLMSNRPLSRHQKSKSLANGSLDDIMERLDIMAREGGSQKWNDTLLRRNHKSEANLKRSSSSGGFSPRSAKGLVQRQKANSRIALTSYT